MRAFIAIDASRPVSDYLSGLALPEKGISRVQSYHMTLKFLGDIRDAGAIIDALEKIRFSRFTLSLSALGAFPSARKPRVLWAGVAKNTSLLKLQIDIDDALPEFRKDFDFSAHITLARVKGHADYRAISSFLKTPLEKMSLDIDRFRLYKSILTPSGPYYEKIKEFRGS